MIAGVIVFGGGALLLLLLLPVMVIEGRSLTAYAVLGFSLAPMLLGGLWMLRIGLRRVTIAADWVEVALPGSVRRLNYRDARVTPAAAGWLARAHLELRGAKGTGPAVRIPRNDRFYPEIEAELKRRAPGMWDRPAPDWPIVGDRRPVPGGLTIIASALALWLLVAIWSDTDITHTSTRALLAGVFFTVVILGLIGWGQYFLWKTVSRIEFATDAIHAFSVLRPLWTRPARDVRDIQVESEKRSVRGMVYYEDVLYLHFTDRTVGVPNLLVLATGYTPRDLAPILGERYSRAPGPAGVDARGNDTTSHEVRVRLIQLAERRLYDGLEPNPGQVFTLPFLYTSVKVDFGHLYDREHGLPVLRERIGATAFAKIASDAELTESPLIPGLYDHASGLGLSFTTRTAPDRTGHEIALLAYGEVQPGRYRALLVGIWHLSGARFN